MMSLKSIHIHHILDIRALAEKSASEVYKIAAKLHGSGPDNSVISFARPNIILHILENLPDLAGASKTIHAETAVIMGAQITDRADLYITDPPCPNCMKNIIASGISRVFIDLEGFSKIWYQKRRDYFDHISLVMAGCAGVRVYIVDPNSLEEPKELHSPISDDFVGGDFAGNNSGRHDSVPIEILDLQDDKEIPEYLEGSKNKFGPMPFALSVGRSHEGAKVLIRVGESYTRGICPEKNAKDHDVVAHMTDYNKAGKYRLKADPVTRLIMAASRYGISLRGSYMYCSHMPSARCQINALGYGIENIQIGQSKDMIPKDLTESAQILTKAQILAFHYKT